MAQTHGRKAWFIQSYDVGGCREWNEAAGGTGAGGPTCPLAAPAGGQGAGAHAAEAWTPFFHPSSPGPWGKLK